MFYKYLYKLFHIICITLYPVFHQDTERLHVRLTQIKTCISFNCCSVVHKNISHFINSFSKKEYTSYFQYFHTIKYAIIMHTPCTCVRVSWKYIPKVKVLDFWECSFFKFTWYCQIVLKVVPLSLALYSSTISPYPLTNIWQVT